MAPPRATIEAKNRKIRKMLHVLRAEIAAEKHEARVMDVVQSCIRVMDGEQCSHQGKCMCRILRMQRSN